MCLLYHWTLKFIAFSLCHFCVWEFRFCQRSGSFCRGWITKYRISTRLPRHIFVLAVTLDLDIHCFLSVSFLCLGVGILSEEWFLLSWLDYNVTHYQVTKAHVCTSCNTGHWLPMLYVFVIMFVGSLKFVKVVIRVVVGSLFYEPLTFIFNNSIYKNNLI